MKKLFPYLRPYAALIIFGLIMKFAGAVAELLLPKLLTRILEDVIPSMNPEEGFGPIFFWGGVMLFCSLCALGGNIVANRISTYSSAQVTRKIRHDLFEKTTYLSAEKVDRYTVSSLVSRLTSDTYQINELIGRIQRMGVRAPILVLGGILLTLTIDRALTLVMVAVLPFIVLTVWLVTRYSVPIYMDEQSTLDSMVRVVQENATGIRVIKALSKTKYEQERFYRVNDELAGKEQKAGTLMGLTNPVTTLLLNLGLCAVVLVGAWRTADGLSSGARILAFMTYFTMILNAMIGITKIFVQLSRGFASADRIASVLNEKRDLPVTAMDAADTPYHIWFDHVSFSYNKREQNIEDVSFGVKRGETLGIIGATGSGKSTLLSLLVRFYDVDQGHVYIDGTDVRSMPPSDLRSKFGIVFQNDFVATDTIRGNIDFYRGLPDEEIERAAADAQALEFIHSDEHGFDREVTARGTNISGGQRQRLLIARALAARPEILVLDDSSSALDYRTDMLLRRALQQRCDDTTTVIVAQRVSAVRHADLILYMDDGRVAAAGTHEQLMKQCPAYAHIAEMQMGGADRA